MKRRILIMITFVTPTLAACESPMDLSMPAPHAECWGSMGCPDTSPWPKELPTIPYPTP